MSLGWCVFFAARAERLGTWTVDILDSSGAIGDRFAVCRRIGGGPQTGPHYERTRVNPTTNQIYTRTRALPSALGGRRGGR